MNPSRLGLPNRTPVSDPYVRRQDNERTHTADQSPTSDISPFVTRTRTYGFGINQIEQEASA